ncbi:MAG: PilT/PilU family type 4a pilus ATPase [Deltaproteobacteria bacterium]|nr:PilT/PilU family type 4a pilus ATPase [Deltaproteobacteria bacterium]
MTIQMDRVMSMAIKSEASDIHLRVGAPPTMVRNGVLVPLQTPALTDADMVSAIKQIAADKPRVETDVYEHGGADFAVQFQEGDVTARFRVSAFKEQGHQAATLRRLPSRIVKVQEIGFPSKVLDLVIRPRGLFLVTGPTGSGKTTTLASIIDYISNEKPQHILTIEEPTEYRFSHGKSIITQREVPNDVESFGDGLRQGLRQAPNTIMVGEMRDIETMEVAIRAAETGHLVLATLHTVSAAKTVDRIIESFPEGKQAEIRTIISTSLLGVLGQQLLLKKDASGRVAAFEFMMMTAGIGNLIRERKTSGINDAIQMGANYGMRLLDEHLYQLVTAGSVDAKEAVLKANEPEKLRVRLGIK